MARSLNRFRRILIALAALLFLYVIVGFVVVPPILKGQLESRGSAALGREVTVEAVRVNPLSLHVQVTGLAVADAELGSAFGWSRLSVDFDAIRSLFGWRYVFSDIELDDPVQRFRIDAEGRLNIADILEKLSEPSEVRSSALPPLRIDRMSVRGWKIEIADETRSSPFSTRVGPMTLELQDFATWRDSSSPFTFEGVTESGESFTWTGNLGINPLQSRGSLSFEGLSVPRYAPYAEEFHRAEVRTGRVAFSTDYEIALTAVLVARLTDTRIGVEDFAVASPGSTEPEVSVSRLEIEIPESDLRERRATIARIDASGVALTVTRRSDGTLDLVDWLAVGADSEEPAETGPETRIVAEEIIVRDGYVLFVDESTPSPARFALHDVALLLREAGTDLTREIALEASFNVESGGRFSFSGSAVPDPGRLTGDVDLSELCLSSLQPYLTTLTNVEIRGGAVSAGGSITVSAASGDSPLNVSWNGSINANAVALQAGDGSGAGATLSSLSIAESRFELEPLSISAVSVIVDQPVVDLVVTESGEIEPLRSLLPAGAGGGDPAGAPDAPGPAARIGELSINNGTVHFRDNRIPEGFATTVEAIAGTLTGLATVGDQRGELDLTATLAGQAPLRLAGSIAPLSDVVSGDLSVDLSNLDLPFLSPYSGRYIGQKIERGKLSLELTCAVDANVVDAANHVAIDQFALGERVESPDALNLPIGLAVALLRDRQGHIELDVPVRGDLSDPQFRFGQVIGRAIGNIISQAAMSPFAMLGGIVGGAKAGEDLSFVAFAPGSATLSDDAAVKAELLEEALFERPSLRLEIRSPVYPELDRPVLRQARLSDLLDAEAERLRLARDTPASDEGIAEPAPEALLRALFARRFPQAYAASLSVPEPLAAEAAETVPPQSTAGNAPPRERKGLFSRTLGALLGIVAPNAEEPSSASKPAPTPAPAKSAARPKPASAEPDSTIPVAEMRERLLDSIELAAGDFQGLANRRASVVQEAILAGGRIEPVRLFRVDGTADGEGDPADGPVDEPRVLFGLR